MSNKPIFITGRFRSGSTLLWNMFRNMPGCVAFYEPCNDLLPTHINHGKGASPSHLNVTSYWDEYLPILKRVESQHSSEFGLSRLFLEPEDNYPQLSGYIDGLIKSAKNRVPVLQFNRIDFRLEWLRHQFPNAKIIHLARNPRDNWYSMVRDLPKAAWKDPFTNTNYDLLIWSISLYHKLPLLFSPIVKTSYHRHYLIWKLSDLMGNRQADLSLDFDKDLLKNSNGTIQKLAEFAEISNSDIDQIAGLIVPPEQGRWKELASSRWFKNAEKQCNSLLDDLGLLDNFGKIPLKNIREKYSITWESVHNESSEVMAYAATRLSGTFRKKYLDLSFFHGQHCIESQKNTRNLQEKFIQENEKHKTLKQRFASKVQKNNSAELKNIKSILTEKNHELNQLKERAISLQKLTVDLDLEKIQLRMNLETVELKNRSALVKIEELKQSVTTRESELEKIKSILTEKSHELNQLKERTISLQKLTEDLEFEKMQSQKEITSLEELLNDEKADRNLTQKVLEQTQKMLVKYESKLGRT